MIGKTGTSDHNWTANLVIATKQLAIAATGANPDYAQTPHGDAFVQHVNKAAVHTMREALAGLPAIQFAAPPTN